MNSQQHSVGIPGDDDYMDLEDEGPSRATGGGCNSNAPAWDPEKMELCRLVDRLLAQEEMRANNNTARQPVQHAVPHKVKLQLFWKKDATAWFRLAEAAMEDNYVVEPQEIFRTVLLHIPHHVLERARGILTLADPSVDPFTELKNRLVELLTSSLLDQCTSILWGGGELGGRRPLELMEDDDGGPAAW